VKTSPALPSLHSALCYTYLPLAALVGSLFLADLILDAAGIGLLWGSPFLILWFLFVCFYVADHVQLKVANAATKLGERN
jgi:hypothetical protein